MAIHYGAAAYMENLEVVTDAMNSAFGTKADHVFGQYTQKHRPDKKTQNGLTALRLMPLKKSTEVPRDRRPMLF
jgi:hypothetical protein